MTFDWRGLPAETLEQHFNPRVACAGAQQHLDDFARRSAATRAHLPGRYGLRYGDGAKATLDVHAPDGADGAAPLVMFIHGGFWRALDKDDHTFVAPALLASGAVLANVNYDLCPTVTLDAMVEQIADAVRYCHAHAGEWGADGGRLFLVGHSAGAHLAAEMLQREWPRGEPAPGAIRGVAALTGIYEPEVILHLTVNAEARIAPEVAARRDCLARAFRLRPRMLVAVGGDEPAGWQAQSTAFAAACADGGLRTDTIVVPGANHFTILERALCDGDPLHAAVTGLWRD